jgi:uncharacterized protein (DUF433 family)
MTATAHRYIVRDPQILSGEPIISGTRTPVRAIVELWRMGTPPEGIPAALPHLTLAQVFDALSYYSDNQAEINPGGSTRSHGPLRLLPPVEPRSPVPGRAQADREGHCLVMTEARAVTDVSTPWASAPLNAMLIAASECCDMTGQGIRTLEREASACQWTLTPAPGASQFPTTISTTPENKVTTMNRMIQSASERSRSRSPSCRGGGA